ncbi:MAG: heme o synthase [Luteibaculaceae bacterium]
MDTINTAQTVRQNSLLKELFILSKVRLSFVVVLSAVLAFQLAPGPFSLVGTVLLAIGGFLVTTASNIINQIFEKDLDALMNRTKARPLAQKRITPKIGWIMAALTALSGLLILWLGLNAKAAILSLLSLILYAFIYTPLKRKTPLAVFVGAFPGAFPPLLGYVAGSNSFGPEPGLLFAVQFLWQFPHFWAIAWVLDDDYKKAGFRLLPSPDGRDQKSAYQILLYTLFLIPVSLLPWALPVEAPMVGGFAAIVAVFAGLGFLYYALKLYKSLEVKDAKNLMFASFVYLPVVQICYVIDKISY